MTYVRWRCGDWSGSVRLDDARGPAAWLAAAQTAAGGRLSRHACTLATTYAGTRFWLKLYPSPDGHRAGRAARMMAALTRCGFAVPEVVLVGRRGDEGLLVTRDAGGRSLLEYIGDPLQPRHEKWRALQVLGGAVAALHRAGFVHGDLVPSNVLARDDELVFLDHDRTRQSHFLVWWQGRRNLVQLGRFVVPGVGMTDRARVFLAYADGRGLSRRARRRLARWVVAKTTARRCAIDRISPEVARRVGFAALMRSGGPFDPARAASGGTA